MKRPFEKPQSRNFPKGDSLLLLYIIIKNLKMSRGKSEMSGSVAYSGPDGVCRAEVGAGVIPCPDTPNKSRWGVGGAKPPLRIAPGFYVNLNYITRLTMKKGKEKEND